MIKWLRKFSERVDRKINPKAWAQHDAAMKELFQENVMLQVESTLLDVMSDLVDEREGDPAGMQQLREWLFNPDEQAHKQREE